MDFDLSAIEDIINTTPPMVLAAVVGGVGLLTGSWFTFVYMALFFWKEAQAQL